MSVRGSKIFIPDPDLDFLPIPYPGFRGQRSTGSRIRIRIRYTVKKDCVQEENECEGILVALGGTYMDKVMDVLLVHFQPNCLGKGKIKIKKTSC